MSVTALDLHVMTADNRKIFYRCQKTDFGFRAQTAGEGMREDGVWRDVSAHEWPTIEQALSRARSFAEYLAAKL